MKKTITFLIALGSTTAFAQLGGITNQLKEATQGTGIPAGLSEEEIGKGLKEALQKGVEKGVDQVSKPDGYLKDPQIKIPLPNEVDVVGSKLRSIGQGQLVDDVIESMNRAAEDAASGAKDIFIAAITGMSIEDAVGLLKGDEYAATKYLKSSTNDELTSKFEPNIKTSLDKVGATRYWNTMMSTYNKIPFVKKVNPDLEKYVTEKAIDGLFIQVAKEESNIRRDPAARTSDLLKKVFE